MISRKNNFQEWLIGTIAHFTAETAENSLGLPSDEKAFDRPLVGFSNGSDPVYKEFKDHIGSFYCTPLELFEKTFPGSGADPKDLVVISWIIPSTIRTRTEQAQQKKYPSERWARTRSFGEDFNNALRRKVVEELKERSILALAPLLSPYWSRYDLGPYAPCSNWSERHAAYAGGLGTFGLCDGLITPVGKAVRVGSVIALLEIPPTPRPYTDHHAYCLHYTHDTCRECIPRCPVHAISERGHDKKRCMQYTEKTMNKYIHDRYGLDTYSCGLCQAGVPCTNGIPDALAYMNNLETRNMAADDRLEIRVADITTLEVDAIVNAANTSLLGGGGVDGAIHRAAGFELKKECAALNGCATGDAVITGGYNLPARYVIHAVGPVWYGGARNEEELLAACYRKCMALAKEHNIRTLAFPAISTGAYGFPMDSAAGIAVKEVRKALFNNPDLEKVVFTCFSQTARKAYEAALAADNGKGDYE